MTRYRLVAALLLAAVLGIAACYPNSPERITDLDAVATVFEPDRDYSQFRTYAMLDSVHHLADDPDDVDHQFDQQILDDVARNMMDLGYQRIPTDSLAGPSPPVLPDVILHVIATSSDTFVVGGGCYPWWGCGGWGGWCGGGWGWCYPPTARYAYSTGSVVIQMIPFAELPETPDEDDLLPVAWAGGINGILNDSVSNVRARLTTLIDQAFTQSPYLDVNP